MFVLVSRYVVEPFHLVADPDVVVVESLTTCKHTTRGPFPASHADIRPRTLAAVHGGAGKHTVLWML